MLYSGENGNTTSFRGKTWKLSNGYTRACNYKGQQCNFKTQNEAVRFANKDKPVNEDTSAILKRNMTSRSGTGLDRKIFPALQRLQAGENMSLREKQWVVKQLQDNVPHTELIKVWKDVRKSSTGGNRDGARAIEGIIDAALDGQKAGLGQAHHGPSRFGDGVNEDKKKVNEVFSLEDLEAISTPGLRRLLASWQKRQKLSPHNQPIADNIEAIESALQFKRSIGETNRINEGRKSHPTPPDLERVLKRHGLKIKQKDTQYREWVHWEKPGGRGGQTGDVMVAIQVADDLKGPVEWSAGWEHSGREIDGHGPAGLDRALKTLFKQANESVNEGPYQPGQRVSGKAPKSMPDRSAFDAIKPGSRVTFRMKRHGVVRGVADRYDRRNDSWRADVLVGDETGIVTRDNFVALGSNKPSMGKGPWKEIIEGVKEAMGSNKPVTVYAKDRKTVLGTVSKQSSSVGASKVAGGAVQQARVDGYLSWVLKEDATTAGSLRNQLRAAKFKKARNVPAGLSSYVKPALQDIWIRGNVVVLTNGILWQAYTDDGGSIGSGTDRDQIMTTLDRSSWVNF